MSTAPTQAIKIPPGMLSMPGGQFTMGYRQSLDSYHRNRVDADHPPVTKNVSSFFMDEAHVTNGRIHRYCDSFRSGERHGVILFLPHIGPRVIMRGILGNKGSDDLSEMKREVAYQIEYAAKGGQNFPYGTAQELLMVL